MATLLLNAAATPAASSIFTSARAAGYRTSVLVQVSITGSATAVVEGRLDSTSPWFTVTTLTASGAVDVVAAPEVRVNVTAVGSGTVSVWAA